ncbi:hypothetical protein [Arenimonas oryziterrae]|uniref:Uncharacterized protein n=1 Tax=Arenimonas oryziterrae DSM 21050 = YC6267 TaxID=1121015 RepID=A0A091AZB4_9GAMM|nr:hypothetical protein [Arenimonas oryziterrae]KFN43954.1 hypothetical protein N789_08370 [Arenimonas oryziterrae DSM 21050 = YC6267]
MNLKHLVAISVVLVSAAATAKQEFPTVEVRAETENSLTIACNNPSQPTPDDVARILIVNDATQINGLRSKLMAAAAEACAAGEENIVVTRGANGKSLSWKARG